MIDIRTYRPDEPPEKTGLGLARMFQAESPYTRNISIMRLYLR